MGGAVTRRQLLLAAAAARVGAAAPAAVAPVDAAKIRPRDFADADLDLPYYLVHFARLANRVRMEPPDRGFIELSVWRNEKDNRPYNARIMENILSLVWFYTARQNWNPYRGDPAVRARIEAALDFWCGIQSPDGKFSEYKPEGWNLAATSFAVKFMSESLRLLKSGPAIDAGIHRRAIESCRKALRVVLYDADLYRHGRAYSNQYTNIFAGGAAFLAEYPDTGLQARLEERFRDSSTELQSPLGYFYEADGPDFGYNLGTHHENVHMEYHYWRRTPLGAILVEQERRFAEWLSYNALPEPGHDFWVLNRSIETRQRHATFDAMDTPVGDRCVIARAFATSPEHRSAALEEARRKLADWPKVDPLPVGTFWAYSPYRFLHRAQYDWHPTAEQIAEARKLLRPLSQINFEQQMTDTRRKLTLTYVRRPAYYAAFAAGEKITAQQRYGLTLVWSPRTGVLLQRQTGDDGSSVDQASFADGVITHAFPNGGRKSIAFADDRIHVRIEGAGAIAETLPLFDPRAISTTSRSVIREQGTSPVPGKKFSQVEITGRDRMEYEIRPT